jgi:asparagine synthetase B (glutamine-hydrolysing)
MCGIFGLIVKENSDYDYKFVKKLTEELAIFSESRGKESAGFSIFNPASEKISVIKGAETVSKLIDNGKFDSFFLQANDISKSELSSKVKRSFALTGHSRLVTNGTQLLDFNNQPVIKDGIVGIHNGIITNVDELWEQNKDLKRECEVDTEVMLSLLRKYINAGEDIDESFVKVFNDIKGAASIAFMFNDKDCLALVTNCGSLYAISNKRNDILIFASEEYFLKELMELKHISEGIGGYEINQVKPFTGFLYNIKTLEYELINTHSGYEKKKINFDLKNTFKIDYKPEGNTTFNAPHLSASEEAKLRGLLEFNYERIKNLKKCTKCLLPETFPFIKYDDKGVCNICNNYKPVNQPKPIKMLEDLVAPYRSKTGAQDCIVPFSGGRDSSYALHVIRKELGLNPVAFTYDWGMVTDLARRNIARICGQLGIENILVSADIKVKRDNIRKNIEAWLKQPDLGMIPLFMAGDKYFFYYCNEVKKHTGIKLNIWGINALENTDFKVGFSGIDFDFEKKRIYSLSAMNQVKLFTHIGKNFVTNPSYLNSSVFDTFGSFFVRYVAPKRDYYHLFDYHQWNEKVIEDTLINEYEWELATDTKSSWRIGDGTAAFYNYVYYTVAGFSEFDTFRSNQIREGMITREEGLELSRTENYPRYDTMKWYFDIVNVDFEKVIKTVNKIPKLYEKLV